MNLTDQVCSLELAKKLKELGVEQDSLFYWSFSCNDENNFVVMGNSALNVICSALTVVELLDLIPLHEDREIIDIIKSDKYYLCSYDQDFFDKNLANCCAMLLIYLIENKLVEINK